jgi:hypothetical protein
MHASPVNPPSRVAFWLPRLSTACVFLAALGFLLHTSPDPWILRKYNLGYAIFLGTLFLAVIPAFHCLARFCAVAHELKSSSGKRVVVRPWQKLTAVVIFASGAYLSANVLLDRLLQRNALGFNSNIFHPYLQNSPTPNDPGQHVNRWGFRGDDIDPRKDDDVFRVFVFGGSTVYCGTVPYEQTHCRVLEKRLRAAYPQYRVEVQNLGAEWHATEHDTIKLLFLAQDFAPDLAIIFHGINDLVRSLSPDMFAEGPYWPDYRHYYGATANLATHGTKTPLLVRAAAGHWCSDLRFDQVRLQGPEGRGIGGMRTLFYPKAREIEINDWKSLPAFERNLRDFVEIARGKGIEVLLATQPSLYRDDLAPAERQLLGFPLSHYFDGQRASLHSMVDGMRQFNDATRRIAIAGSIELVDLDERMPKTTDYLYDDVHYTKTGNELIGNAFADAILETKLVDRAMERRGEARNPSPNVTPRPNVGLRAARR